MSRFRGLVMLLILAGIIGFVALLRTSTGTASETAGTPARVSISGGQVILFGTTTPTPPQDNVTPTVLLAPIQADGQTDPLIPTGTVTSIAAEALQTALPINTPSANSTTVVENWNPPALEVPIAHNPRDHYWFIRPVAAKYQNFELSTYPYGSNGPENDLRIHHGIDLPNPIGVEVLAAGKGTVIMAQKGFSSELENISSYGNVIVIDHDFGYNGQHIYTLYAHLSAILVQPNDHVDSGQVIGLIGNTGQVTGPHVHFEVRIGRDTYGSVRNPILWMAPYENTGVIAGRVGFSDRSAVNDAIVTLIDAATGNVVDRTDTYAGFGVNSDDNWNENFVFPDVPAGHYLVTSTYNTATWTGTVDVIPGATNWVNLERFSAETLPQSTP
jgi:murein DD-endopeptidase MepM/ murein hydrolase activator NlpD